jgi:transcriptional regulator with GAF, ATPase, and Fis domain
MIQHEQEELLPWLRKKMIKKEVVYVFNVDKLKKKAKNERKIFQEQNIKSIVIVPIFIKDEIWGFFGFDSVVEKKNIKQGKIDNLKIIADVITSAVLQYTNIKRSR